MNLTEQKLPELGGSIVLYFPKEIPKAKITELFKSPIDMRIFDDEVEITYKELKKFYSWEVNDLLTSLFSLCDLDVLLNARMNMNAKILVDIVFYHYNDIYPALLFEGDNMEIIHKLHADISIDPY